MNQPFPEPCVALSLDEGEEIVFELGGRTVHVVHVRKSGRRAALRVFGAPDARIGRQWPAVTRAAGTDPAAR